MHASPSKSKLASASVAMSGLLPISSIAPASAETGKVKFKLKRSKSKKSKKLLKKD